MPPFFGIVFWGVMGAILIACFIDCLCIPVVFLLKSANYIAKGYPELGREYSAKKFSRRKYAIDKLMTGSNYFFADAFCSESDKHYAGIMSELIKIKIPEKYSAKMISMYFNYDLYGSQAYYFRGRFDKARQLYDFVKLKADSRTRTSGTVLLLEICEAFLLYEGTDQLQIIDELIKKNNCDVKTSSTIGGILYYRKYQLTGESEYLKKSKSLSSNFYIRLFEELEGRSGVDEET
jgi:hypothetical protein